MPWSKTFSTWLKKKSKELKRYAEIRFYLSGEKIELQSIAASGEAELRDRMAGSLQAFQGNYDQSVFPVPLNERRTLPVNIVFYPEHFDDVIYLDEKNNVMWLPVGRGTSGNIIFYDLAASKQIPKQDRTLTFLDGKTYTDGGDDILLKVETNGVIPDVELKSSAPITAWPRQPTR